MLHSFLNLCYAYQLSMEEQLHSELSQSGQSLSSPSAERLRCWRLFFESAMALVDVLDAELERDAGISQRWYDVLVHLEESPHGIPMNALADRILYSKSGFTRVVDRMEAAGLIQRVRPEDDRRTILVVLTETGTATLQRARRYHRDGVERHFAQHLTDTDVKALTRSLEKISAHARPLRPGRIRN
jgi:DNA-binding MarR family transcriptional regulator